MPHPFAARPPSPGGSFTPERQLPGEGNFFNIPLPLPPPARGGVFFTRGVCLCVIDFTCSIYRPSLYTRRDKRVESSRGSFLEFLDYNLFRASYFVFRVCY
jgi:hypothetical protein